MAATGGFGAAGRRETGRVCDEPRPADRLTQPDRRRPPRRQDPPTSRETRS